MNPAHTPQIEASTPEDLGVEFARAADDMAVARIGDLVFAMVPAGGGQYLLASAWRVSRPLAALKRDDFYSHHGAVADEAAFRDRMIEQAEHSRELGLLSRQSVRMTCSTPWGASQSPPSTPTASSPTQRLAMAASNSPLLATPGSIRC
ncbi:hypothetical protein GGI64_005860 [Rhizobium leguminosarum]|uniref:Uncharacterized protein n=1 Tax=Rhizobium leguminosarum TaxID=384 RepID=A0A7Z0E5K8_RHILE|nr:hypothetical protein [Rhizobium leguminosarum]